MPQSERRLHCVGARPEKFKFELSLQCACIRRDFRLDPKSSLPDAKIGIAVSPKFICEGWELDGSNHVEPVWVHLLEIVTGIHLDETIDVQLRLGCLWL